MFLPADRPLIYKRRMWSARAENLSNGTALKTSITHKSSAMTFAEVLRGWQEDAAFRAFFTELLAASPFTDFRWETPPIASATADRAFEFVLLDSPGLADVADAEAFADYFATSRENADVISFPNLGRDATLVVPCPLVPASCYRHLAAFLREAPDSQRHSLWRTVGEVMEKALGRSPRWLSTAGAGVSWLHVRIDKQPKYYGYAPYREHLS